MWRQCQGGRRLCNISEMLFYLFFFFKGIKTPFFGNHTLHPTDVDQLSKFLGFPETLSSKTLTICLLRGCRPCPLERPHIVVNPKSGFSFRQTDGALPHRDSSNIKQSAARLWRCHGNRSPQLPDRQTWHGMKWREWKRMLILCLCDYVQIIANGGWSLEDKRKIIEAPQKEFGSVHVHVQFLLCFFFFFLRRLVDCMHCASVKWS